MADSTLYTRTYTCTSIGNTRASSAGAAGTKSISLSKFSVSGDKSHKIGKISSITFKHYHSVTNPGYVNSYGIQIRSSLIMSGKTISSPYKTWNTFGNVAISKTDAFSTMPTAAQFATLSSIRIEWKSYSSHSDFYYRAASGAPMVLTVKFYAEEEKPPTVVTPEGIIRYRGDSGFIDTQPFFYTADGFKRCIPYYYDGTKWVEV